MVSVKYVFIDIAPKSNLTWSGSQSEIYQIVGPWPNSLVGLMTHQLKTYPYCIEAIVVLNNYIMKYPG